MLLIPCACYSLTSRSPVAAFSRGSQGAVEAARAAIATALSRLPMLCSLACCYSEQSHSTLLGCWLLLCIASIASCGLAGCWPAHERATAVPAAGGAVCSAAAIAVCLLAARCSAWALAQ